MFSHISSYVFFKINSPGRKGVLCPGRETPKNTKEPIPMQTQEGFFQAPAGTLTHPSDGALNSGSQGFLLQLQWNSGAFQRGSPG